MSPQTGTLIAPPLTKELQWACTTTKCEVAHMTVQMETDSCVETRNFDLSDGIEVVPIKIESGLAVSDVATFRYCKVNVPGSGLHAEVFTEQFEGCGCRGTCVLNSCPCMMRYGQAYDDQGRLLPCYYESFFRMKPILECNRSCKCSMKCSHRTVQKGVQFHFEVFETKVKGHGLRSFDRIKKNTFVCEYAGEVLSLEESQRRSGLQKAEDKNYILVLNEHTMHESCEKILRSCVDPEHVGNVGRFINHSCDPNLIMIPVRVNNDIPKLSLFALRDIMAGEELTFNYAGVSSFTQSSLDEDKSASEEASTSSQKISRKKCFCGSSNCQGYLPFDPDLYTCTDLEASCKQ